MSLVLALPNEVMLNVATFLCPKDLRTCTTICEQLYMTCRQYNLWKRFFVDLSTSSVPEGRLCHTGVTGNGRMYIFGGHITQPSSEYFHTVKNDVYEFDLATRQWTEYSLETAPRRTEHSAVYYNDLMIVFGGYSGNGYENSVMIFDTRTKEWSQLSTQGESPVARSAHTAVMVGSTMYIFGGWNGVHCMNDLHALDLESGVWRLVIPATAASPRENSHTTMCYGMPPTARCSHGAVVVSDPSSSSNSMFIFGGYSIEGAADSSNKGYLNDLLEFNFETLTWRSMHPQGPAPSPRSRFRILSHHHNVYLFAGWNSQKHFNSLHRLDTRTNQWSEVETTFDQDGIGQFSMVENDGIMYVFSGFSPSTGTRSNLFAYPLVPMEVQSP